MSKKSGEKSSGGGAGRDSQTGQAAYFYSLIMERREETFNFHTMSTGCRLNTHTSEVGWMKRQCGKKKISTTLTCGSRFDEWFTEPAKPGVQSGLCVYCIVRTCHFFEMLSRRANGCFVLEHNTHHLSLPVEYDPFMTHGQVD